MTRGWRDLEHRAADPVPVADAHLVVGQSLDGEVLAELAVTEVVAAELLLPVAVRVHLVDEHRALLAAVAARSPWPSPSMLSRRTIRGPSSRCFHTAVRTVRPCQVTSRGRPTFTESKLPACLSMVTPG